MKKLILSGIILCLVGLKLQAQVLETMEEQIAALKVYIQTAEKGYAIVEQGIHTIRDIKNGEFGLHSVYFGSLQSVNPSVRDMPEVREIISLETSVIGSFSKALAGYRQTSWLHPDEISYIGQVYSDLLDRSQQDGNTLASLTTDGSLEMDDGKRTQRIQALDGETREWYGYVQAFIRQANLLIVQRQKAAADLGGLGNWYNLNKQP